jgi:hypothetical protein
VRAETCDRIPALLLSDERGHAQALSIVDERRSFEERFEGLTCILVAAPSDDDLAAEDVDLIEHEWVARAKKVVAQTIGNPHAQTNELNKVRADYIKKRYNRTIKSKATS